MPMILTNQIKSKGSFKLDEGSASLGVRILQPYVSHSQGQPRAYRMTFSVFHNTGIFPRLNNSFPQRCILFLSLRFSPPYRTIPACMSALLPRLGNPAVAAPNFYWRTALRSALSKPPKTCHWMLVSRGLAVLGEKCSHNPHQHQHHRSRILFLSHSYVCS